MARILIIDDEPTVLAAFGEMVDAEGHTVLTRQRADEALAAIELDPPDLVVLDICMPGMNGLDALRSLKQKHPKLPVIVMTGQGTMSTAIEATKRGAFEYHLKPFDPEEMLQTIARALEVVRLMQRQVALATQPPEYTGDVIVGQSPAMQQVYKTIGRVAPTEATVLVRGESGSGKELVARAVYQHSRRAGQPLLVVNCASLPEALLESELFGHERGAFTGAIARRIGKFEQAAGGTLFLDEIGEVPLSVQAKLLRVLQEREFHRVGSNETLIADARVIVATNRDLEQAMARREFREDLYHRLNVVTVQLPPLRQRQDDIPHLVAYFVQRFARELAVPPPLISDQALQLLLSYPWPGNVRELQYCIHRTMILHPGQPLQAEDIRANLQPAEDRPVHSVRTAAEPLAELARRFFDEYGGETAHAEFLAAAERVLLTEALRRADGNQTQAARLLGLPRPTLHARLQRLGVAAGSQQLDAPSKS